MFLFGIYTVMRAGYIFFKGLTKVYNRRGEKKSVFQSNLPGGGKFSKAITFTLLDCIYRAQEKTYYVLDVLVWNSHSLLNCSVSIYKKILMRSCIIYFSRQNLDFSFLETNYWKIPH